MTVTMNDSYGERLARIPLTGVLRVFLLCSAPPILGANKKLRAGDRVVDMATGTADVAIMISEELAKLEGAPGDRGTIPGTVEPEVIGIDPSARMLEVSFTFEGQLYQTFTPWLLNSTRLAWRRVSHVPAAKPEAVKAICCSGISI